MAVTLHASRYTSRRRTRARADLRIGSWYPDLVVLGLGLTELDGAEVAGAGADSYVTKAVSMYEVLARLRTAIAHAPTGRPRPATPARSAARDEDAA